MAKYKGRRSKASYQPVKKRIARAQTVIRSYYRAKMEDLVWRTLHSIEIDFSTHPICCGEITATITSRTDPSFVLQKSISPIGAARISMQRTPENAAIWRDEFLAAARLLDSKVQPSDS